MAQVKELDRVPPFSLDAGVSGMMRHHLATGDDASIMVVRLPVGPFFFGAHWVRPDTTDLEHEQ
nr:hypothetical protein [Aeromonas dhakensis]